MRRSASAMILAGGFSRRMGEDKALIAIAGKPAFSYVAKAAGCVADDIWLVRRQDQSALPESDVSLAGVVYDLRSGEGPLAGMEAGWTSVRHDWSAVLPADAPLIRPALLKGMWNLLMSQISECKDDPIKVQALIPKKEGRTYPLLGFYHRSSLPIITALLNDNRRRVQDLLDQLRVIYVEEDYWEKTDQEGVSFLMMNNKQEYDQVCKGLAGGGWS